VTIFRLHVLMDSAAFDDAPATELARVLRQAAGLIAEGQTDPTALRDRNGNTVGGYIFATVEA